MMVFEGNYTVELCGFVLHCALTNTQLIKVILYNL